MNPPANIEYVTADTLISREPCILYGARPRVAADHQVISLYDGNDPTSGRLIDYFDPSHGFESVGQYGPGVFCPHGLYVDIGTAGDTITIAWGPVLVETGD